MLSTLKRRMVTLTRCEQGIAYIEFALSITVLLIMFYGAIEVSRYILIVQKVEKTIGTLTDVLTQTTSQTVSSAQITDYLNAAPQLMSPYTFSTNGIVILTDITYDGNSTYAANWQVCGGGTLASPSRVAPEGTYSGNPPPGFVWNTQGQAEEIVVGEIYYQYVPLLTQDIISPATLYRDAVFTPRFQTKLHTTAPNCP